MASLVELSKSVRQNLARDYRDANANPFNDGDHKYVYTGKPGERKRTIVRTYREKYSREGMRDAGRSAGRHAGAAVGAAGVGAGLGAAVGALSRGKIKARHGAAIGAAGVGAPALVVGQYVGGMAANNRATRRAIATSHQFGDVKQVPRNTPTTWSGKERLSKSAQRSERTVGGRRHTITDRTYSDRSIAAQAAATGYGATRAIPSAKTHTVSYSKAMNARVVGQLLSPSAAKAKRALTGSTARSAGAGLLGGAALVGANEAARATSSTGQGLYKSLVPTTAMKLARPARAASPAKLPTSVAPAAKTPMSVPRPPGPARGALVRSSTAGQGSAIPPRA